MPSIGTAFVDQRSGIAFTVPAGYALVSIAPPGREHLGEFDFPTFQVVANDSAYQFTYSGSHEPLGAPDVLGSVMIASSEWLSGELIHRVPSQYQHDMQLGSHRVTVLDQFPGPWGDEIRTYVVILPHGYGVALLTSNDVAATEDHLVHSVIESVRT